MIVKLIKLTKSLIIYISYVDPETVDRCGSIIFKTIIDTEKNIVSSELNLK